MLVYLGTLENLWKISTAIGIVTFENRFSENFGPLWSPRAILGFCGLPSEIFVVNDLALESPESSPFLVLLF